MSSDCVQTRPTGDTHERARVNLSCWTKGSINLNEGVAPLHGHGVNRELRASYFDRSSTGLRARASVTLDYGPSAAVHIEGSTQGTWISAL